MHFFPCTDEAVFSWNLGTLISLAIHCTVESHACLLRRTKLHVPLGYVTKSRSPSLALYVHPEGSGHEHVRVLVHVHDCLVVGSHAGVEHVKDEIIELFDVKNTRALSFF